MNSTLRNPDSILAKYTNSHINHFNIPCSASPDCTSTRLLLSLLLVTSARPDNKKDKFEGFESCDPSSKLAEIGLKSIFQPVWP